ncbi:Hypothetical predicted protein [Mytilus galloprovincialis]|uniref:Uncharacterized protein n=1 Tax=Mytilus galloprovincialis TaxID=29158 RepID=A0A8B6CA15_MYTGA|nr:Hypothetical predicted protein [Mytilus galloprovincialis]
MLGSVSMETKQQSEKRKEAAIFLAINVITDLNESVTTEAFSSSTATDNPASTTESTTANTPEELQILLDTAESYSKQENCKLQPTKCAVISMNIKDKDCQQFSLGNNILPQPETCVHLGITHTRNKNKTFLPTLPTILRNLIKIDAKRNIVNVEGNDVLDGGVRAFQRKSFNDLAPINVKFA